MCGPIRRTRRAGGPRPKGMYCTMLQGTCQVLCSPTCVWKAYASTSSLCNMRRPPLPAPYNYYYQMAGGATRRQQFGVWATSLQTADVAFGQQRAKQESMIHTHLHALERRCKHILTGQHVAPSSACSVYLLLSESWWRSEMSTCWCLGNVAPTGRCGAWASTLQALFF